MSAARALIAHGYAIVVCEAADAKRAVRPDPDGRRFDLVVDPFALDPFARSLSAMIEAGCSAVAFRPAPLGEEPSEVGARATAVDVAAAPDAGAEPGVLVPLFQPEAAAQEAEQLEAKRRIERLSPRERAVLERLIAGRSTRQIAIELYVSMPTVRTHIRSILQKLDARSQLSAVAVALRAGVVASLRAAPR